MHTPHSPLHFFGRRTRAGTAATILSRHAARISPAPFGVTLCALLACIGTAASAQTAAPAAPADKAEPRRDVIELTPFEVTADANDTYTATNTNSVTGTNTPLNKTPLDAKVFNREFMDELGVVDMTQMLAQFGGLGPALSESGTVDFRGNVDGDRQDPKSMMMRGLQINNPRRDGFLRSDTTLLDSFDIERVEAIGGSNSLLFGSGDAGGVITSTSKRAYLNRKPRVSIGASADSENSWRSTLDAQAGAPLFALRLNAVKASSGYFRPIIGRKTEGIHLAGTLQPWKRLQIRGEFRHYDRAAVIAQAAIVRAPLTMLLDNGSRVDNQHTRYLAAFPEITERTGGVLSLTNSDSILAKYRQDNFVNEIRSTVAELALTDNLALQVRYGHDVRVNKSLMPSSTTVYAPGATGNNYVDPVTGERAGKWAANESLNYVPYWTGARGWRSTLAYKRNLGRWGMHQGNVFAQDMTSWVAQRTGRFYEVDAEGTIVQNPALVGNTESGRITMPAAWIEAFPTSVIGGLDWFANVLDNPNGKRYRLDYQVYPNAVPGTPGNPLGLSGPTDPVTGQSTVSASTFTLQETREKSAGASLFSEWWKGRIDTMIGFRTEEANTVDFRSGERRGPLDYNTFTAGIVMDTPVKDLRLTANYATNAKINFDTTLDLFNNPLPIGKGVSRDIGLKLDLFGGKLSGNANYYVSEARNFTGDIPSRDDIDPDGINGRHGGSGYVYNKTSDGVNLTISARPTKGWELRLNYATANGSERSDVVLPQFYNDQFNTVSVNGQTAVAIRSGTSLQALLVPSDPANPASPRIPLTLAMMKDLASPYYAVLDPESGRILNAQTLGLTAPGVGTGANGLPLSEHQLGFVSPSGGSWIVRRAGEKTFGYPEHSYSIVNRYQFDRGLFRGLVVGLSSSHQRTFRVYMYTDASDGNARKMLTFPNRTLHDLFAVYRFTLASRSRVSLQLNVTNILDSNRVVHLLNTSTGALRYAQWFNTPRKWTFSTSLSF